MLFLRYTKDNEDLNTRSFDGFTGKELNGVCCYSILDFYLEKEANDYTHEDICEIAAAQQAGLFAQNSDGHFIVFEGEETEKDPNQYDRFGNKAVVAYIDKVVFKGICIY